MTLTQNTDTLGLDCTLKASSDFRKAKDVVQVTGRSSEKLRISFQRTIRVPDGKGDSELPPGMGTFPLYSVESYKEKLPASMANKGGLFLPMYQREAMWIRFDSRDCFAITVRVGGVNAISGEPLLENQASTLRRLSLIANGKSVQDYVVTPNQLWLDGVASNDGSVRQFVAMPLGSGYSIEAQVTGEDLVGGLQFEITPSTKPPKVVIAPPIPSDALYPSKELFVETPTGQMIVIQNISSHHFLDQVKEMIAQKEGIPVDEQRLIYDGRQLSDGYTLGDYEIPDKAKLLLLLRLRGGGPPPKESELGIAPGGLIKQCILEDTNPASIWEPERTICFNVQVLNSEAFRQVTGTDPPETPISAKTYASHGLPFFKIFDEKSPVQGGFKDIKSVGKIDSARAGGDPEEKRARAAYDEPALKNPIILLNSEGAPKKFCPVSMLKQELASMNAVKF